MGKITTDDKNGWLRVEGEGKSYFVELTELVTPNAPTIGITIYDVVKDSFDILVKNNTTGATMEYKIGENDTWKQIPNNNKITYDTGYTNEKKNDPIYLKIHLRATKNGVESGVNIVDITVNPKVASGSVTVVRTSDWSTIATITLSPSPTKDAQSKYSVDKGSSWEYLLDSKTITVSTGENEPMEIKAETYQVQATKGGYEDATTVKSSVINIGARKTYYGFSSNGSLNNLSDITSLETTGGVLEAHKLNTKTTYYIYPSKSGSTKDGYIWLCCKDSLIPGKIFSDAEAIIPFGFIEAEGISGYKCYRSENLLSGNENLTIYIKD
jgi:hypothetical protein